jgi:hypothetical protein
MLLGLSSLLVTRQVNDVLIPLFCDFLKYLKMSKKIKNPADREMRAAISFLNARSAWDVFFPSTLQSRPGSK